MKIRAADVEIKMVRPVQFVLEQGCAGKMLDPSSHRFNRHRLAYLACSLLTCCLVELCAT